MLAVERHFLLTYGGGFTENFYGLKRERVLRVRGGEVPRAQLGAAAEVRETLKLRNSDVWKNLAVMVGLPYLKRKLDESYDIHAAHTGVLVGGGHNRGRDELGPDATLKQKLMFYYKWFLRTVYPSVNAAYYFSLLAFNLAYLFDGSKYHSPFLWLIGTRIRRLGEADHRAIALAMEPKPAAPAAPGAAARPGESSSIFNPRTLSRSVYPRLLSSLRILLPTSIFALKFLEWWHASDFARQLSRKAAENIELPPPITSGLAALSAHLQQQRKNKQPTNPSQPGPSTKSSVSLSSSLKHDSSTPAKRTPPISSSTLLPILTVLPSSHTGASGDCPICLRQIQTATAAPSGYVYCYKCIHQWVQGDHDRQIAFMEGKGGGEEGWGEDIDDEGNGGSREGRWESGKGRDAVTGQKILGGEEALRRVVV